MLEHSFLKKKSCSCLDPEKYFRFFANFIEYYQASQMNQKVETKFQ